MGEMETTRDAADRPVARPAAQRLHPYQPAPRQGGVGAVMPGAAPFHANPLLRLAQLAVLAQTVLAVMTGISLITGAESLAKISAGVTLTAGSTIATRYAVGILVIAGLLAVLTAMTNAPWRAARAALVVVETVMLGVTLAAHFGGGSVLGLVSVLAMGASGSALIPVGAVVGLQALAVYALAIHPPTYRAFAR